MPGENFINLAEKGDFHNLVREYVEYGLQLGKGTLTDAEKNDYIAFEEYMQESIGKQTRIERETPKRSTKILTGFLAEMALYRAELLVQSGLLAEKNETRIRSGEVPGTELYIGNETAVRDISDCMMNGSELYAKTVLTSAGIKLVSMSFDETGIDPETAEKLGYESLSMAQFTKSPMHDMMNDHVKAMGPEYMRFMKRGESLMSDVDLADKYGIKPAGNGFTYSVDKNGVSKTAELAAERNKKTETAVNNYTETLKTVVETAKGLLSSLKELEAKKSSNSAQFKAMVEALTDVAGTNGNLDSPALIEDRLNRLKESAKAYMDRIDGSIFRGYSTDGQNRREMAERLSDFAGAWDERLKKAGDGRLNEYLPVGAQAESLKKNRETIENEMKRAAEAQAKTAEQTKTVEQPKTSERSKTTNLAGLMKAEKAAKAKPEEKNSVRDELLRKREAIMKKRRENEKAGVVNDGKNQAPPRRGKA